MMWPATIIALSLPDDSIATYREGKRMAVNRCICNDVLFADALALARKLGCDTVRALQSHSALGTGCGLCVPYMQRSIETGETDLPVFGERERAHWLHRSGVVAEGLG